MDKIFIKGDCIANMIGNLFLLVPMNIFLNLLFHNKFKKINNVILTGLIISASIELLQYIEMYFRLVYSRAFDITDIILNTLGFIVGHVLFIKNCDALFLTVCITTSIPLYPNYLYTSLLKL
ncbi:VanZ family protein [Clostridium tetani]|uniref:VanZ family protein n=1 Tax=Clostridium tetani TaxID=1513 RepID=UPI002955B730|nr:VanZ family protein [Clostridium tetani]